MNKKRWYDSTGQQKNEVLHLEADAVVVINDCIAFTIKHYEYKYDKLNINVIMRAIEKYRKLLKSYDENALQDYEITNISLYTLSV